MKARRAWLLGGLISLCGCADNVVYETGSTSDAGATSSTTGSAPSTGVATSTTVSTGTGMATGGAGGGPSEAFTVWIFETKGKVTDAETPIGGAVVDYDSPNGGRIELTTAADGHATFSIDTSSGPGNVTAFFPAHRIVTDIGVSPETVGNIPHPAGYMSPAPAADLVIHLSPLNALQNAVTVNGKLTNPFGPGEFVGLSNDSLYDYEYTVTSDYKLTVPKGAAYTIYGVEAHAGGVQPPRGLAQSLDRWFTIPGPVESADAAADFDLSQATDSTVTTVHANAAIPGGEEGPMGGASRCGYAGFSYNDSARPTAVLGAAANCSLGSDGQSFDFEITTMDATPPGQLVMGEIYIEALNGAASIRYVAPYPKDGDKIDGLDVPLAIPKTPVKVTDPIALPGAPSTGETDIRLADADGNPFWGIAIVAVPVPASFTLPALPTGASFPATVKATLYTDTVRGPDLPNTVMYTNQTMSAAFTIEQ